MKDDPGFRKAILASLVASMLVLVFIQPILGLVVKGLVWIGNNVYVGFSDQIYRNAALGQRNYVDFTIFLWLIVGLIMFLIENLGWSVAPKQVSPANREVKTLDQAQVRPRKRSAGNAVKMALLLGFVGLSLAILTLAFTDLQLNTSFRQRLTVLAPQITEQEHKELLASWAGMRSRRDYDLIMERMNSLAQMHDIVLPRPLLN